MILEMESLDDFIDELRVQEQVIDDTVRFSVCIKQRNVATADYSVSASALFKTPSNLVVLMTWDGYCGNNDDGKALANAAAMDMKRLCEEAGLMLRPGRIKFPKDGA